MRLFLGMIVGALLTIGAAYFHDTGRVPGSGDRPLSAQRPMVNWDVVQENWREVTGRVRQEWAKLSSR